MKKNRMLRIASVMLVLAILTTCIISGTFAKYITEGKVGEDSARVAKWGVVIQGAGNMFAKNYIGHTAAEGADTGTPESTGITVQSSTQDNVVAPGTKGDLAAFKITGTPEVSVAVTYTAVIELNNWTVPGEPVPAFEPDDYELPILPVDSNDAFYCPLIFKVKSTTGTTTINGANYSSATGDNGLIKAIQDAIAAYTKTYDPNTNLESATTGTANDTLTISWEWPFDGNNEKDTILGNAAAEAANFASSPNIKVTVTATVTQID
ncbi:MAG: hypothetical protein IJM51_06340 [Clostridia bacterium]|nr:hypothetical protein [Clostridia bacterium]